MITELQIVHRPSSIVLAPSWQDQFKAYLEVDHRKVTRRQLSDSSIQTAMQRVREFSLWYEAEIKQIFNPFELVNYHFTTFRKHSLNEAKVKARTWNSRLWALTLLCQWMGKPELLEGVNGKKHNQLSEKYRSLTKKERHDLHINYQKDIDGAVTQFDHYCAVRDYAMFTLMLEAGLRVSECEALEIQDISIGERSGSVLVRDGKGEKERLVPLPGGDEHHVRKALKKWITVRGTPQTSALWLGKETQQLSARSMERIVKVVSTRIGSPDITPHCLRYEFAKNLQRKGMDVIDISRLLGHNSIEVTKRYLRSSMDDLLTQMQGSE
jgi:site-specific recombinase XerD